MRKMTIEFESLQEKGVTNKLVQAILCIMEENNAECKSIIQNDMAAGEKELSIPKFMIRN